MTDKALIKQLLNKIDRLTAMVEELEVVKLENDRLSKRVLELEEKLSKYENPKHSGNSSVAPLQDLLEKLRVFEGYRKRKQVAKKVILGIS